MLVEQLSELLYSLFKHFNLLPSLQDLWRQTASELLAEPEAEVDQAHQQVTDAWRRELLYLFQPQANHVSFKAMPGGNPRSLIYLQMYSTIVLDVGCPFINKVQHLLASELGMEPDTLECQKQDDNPLGCNCLLQGADLAACHRVIGVSARHRQGGHQVPGPDALHESHLRSGSEPPAHTCRCGPTSSPLSGSIQTQVCPRQCAFRDISSWPSCSSSAHHSKTQPATQLARPHVWAS